MQVLVFELFSKTRIGHSSQATQKHTICNKLQQLKFNLKENLKKNTLNRLQNAKVVW